MADRRWVDFYVEDDFSDLEFEEDEPQPEEPDFNVCDNDVGNDDLLAQNISFTRENKSSDMSDGNDHELEVQLAQQGQGKLTEFFSSIRPTFSVLVWG